MDKNRLKTVPGVLLLSGLLSGIALLENTRLVPWSPFYVLYAGLAIGIPLWLGAYRFGPIAAVRWWHWLAGALAAVLLQVIGGVFFAFLVPQVGALLGVRDGLLETPAYSISAALQALFQVSALRFQASPEAIANAYLLFIFLWAGLGEELFYRGYLHGVLRTRLGFGLAALVSAGFFAIRHAFQLALLWPAYPWWAAFSWMIFAFFFGILMSCLYERRGSLYLPVWIHAIFNALALL